MATYYEVEYSAYANQTGQSGIALNEQKLSFYNAQLSTNYNNVDEAEIAFLKNQTGLYDVNSTEHLWKSYLVSQGVANSDSLQSMKFYFFENVGFTNLQSYIKSLSGLVAYYPMDETSGNMINRAPNTLGSYDGTVTGATQGVAGQSGNSYSFDRVNDVVTVGTSFDPNYTDMTIGGIIFVTTASQGNNRTLMAKVDTYAVGDMRWQASINASNQFFLGRSGSSVAFTVYGNTYPKDTFFMFHIIKTAASTKLYINASLVETGAAFALSTDGASVFSIGARGSTPSEFFGGQMQHMQVFNVALAESAMTQMKTLAGL